MASALLLIPLISDFAYSCEKIPDKNQLTEGRVFFHQISRVQPLLTGKPGLQEQEAADDAAFALREVKRHECWYSILSSFFQPKISANGMVPPKFRVGLASC